MLNTLLKKQMMEINQSFFHSKKTGKKRSRTAVMVSMALFAILMVFVIGGLFLAMSWMLSPLVGLGMSWMYFLIMAAAAIALGLFGSVFNTYSSLYQAKDNDLLLSLPIPVRYILFTRLTGVYLMGLMYSMIVFIPAIIIYLINTDITPAAVAGPIIFALLLSVFVFVLACALGWAVAKVSSKLRNKSLVTVVLSLAFLGAYYVLYFRANELIKSLVANAASISSTVMSRARALYFIGDAAAGNMKALAVLAAATAALTVLVLYVIAKTFSAVATSSGGASRRVYREKASDARVKSVQAALLQKEFRRFAASSTYMLNCAMGTVFMLIAAAACILKGEYVINAAAQFGGSGSALTVMAAMAVCMMMSANNISAPSISMEGSSLWILRSLPVRPQDILRAKLRIHMIATDIPAVICIVCLCILLRPGLITAVLMFVIVLAYGTLSAEFGLAMNIKNPNMSWTSETAAVKQNFSVAAVIFGGWIAMAVLTGLYILLSSIIPAQLYLAVCAAVFAAGASALYKWIMTAGSDEFERIFS